MEYQHQLAELNSRIEIAEKEKIFQQQQNRIRMQNYLFIGIGGLMLLSALLVHSHYRRYKLRQESILKTALMKQHEHAVKAVIEAEENERQRIAQDLHDGVGQMMSAAKMNLSAFESEIDFQNQEQKNSLHNIIQLVDESCKEIRSVSHQMMPNALLKSGLASAVKEFLDKIDNRIIKINLHTEGLQERLDSNTETVLYRVIQECVNNVIKHSGANNLDISLIKDADGIAATVEDNGWVYLKMKDVAGIERHYSDAVLDTGSPHYIKTIIDIKQFNVVKHGKEIRYSEDFKEKGINVNFVEPNGKSIFVRTYERGVEDETLSCGTGVTAAALVYAHNDNGFNRVEVKTLGGNLAVEFDRKGEDKFENIWLCGPADFVFKGEVTI